ncbi:IclR family transcriptional regulator [Paenibacillus sp. IB182496]|uniref:IclR family transcriptional regulator n=1 Tax=Paenibacillus sabuli TaxID=2772509 RepID=A0A927BW37_9BACL|nr:IclR family transcriptional regulator [Paenibacillus sabuli]MBD2847402.1 IclR family transcriptional regulator [Paenibacillus sabuli]
MKRKADAIQTASDAAAQGADAKPNRYAIHSVEKALDVIEALSEHSSLSLIQLSEIVNQPKSSLFRIVLTLEDRGFISRSDDDGYYCLGYKPLVITKRLLERSTLRASAMSEMQKLVDKYGDTVNLCALLDEEIIYIEIIEGTFALRMTDQVGSKAPVHATATGKAIAAMLPEETVRALVTRKGMEPRTPNTITTMPALRQELALIRARGYAVDNEEITLGARCVAAPILNMFGRVEGAISLSGALHRFPDEAIAEIAADVKATARAISMKLGFVEE